MKGNLTFVAVLMLAMLILIATSISPKFSIFGEDESTFQKISLQSNIYSMSHAIDTAKIYTKTALRYSVYQACYDSLREASDHVDKVEYYKTLGEIAEKHYQKYTSSGYSFLGDFVVTFPDYTLNVIPGGDDRNFAVQAIPNEKLTISSSATSGEAITLRESADIVENFTMPCYPLYKNGKNIHQPIEADFQAALDQALDWEIMKSDTRCQTNEECTPLIKKNLESNTKVVFSKEEGDLQIKAEVSDISVGITTVTDKATPPVITQVYEVSATQTVTISGKNSGSNQAYPVWNGEEVAFEPLELSFTSTLKSKQTGYV